MNDLEKFQEEIYEEKEWHAKELGIYKSIPHRYSNGIFYHITNVYWKMCVPMIYSHWEGFIVYLLRQVCEFINKQGLPYERVKESIAIFSLMPQMGYLSGNAGWDNMTRFYSEFTSLYDNPLNIDCGKTMSARSNLNYKQFTKMLSWLSIVVPDEITCQKATIEKLVAYRNKIAHGENSIVVYENDINEFITTIIQIFDMLIVYIIKYLENRDYLK